jgi:predicted dehydrogenase
MTATVGVALIGAGPWGLTLGRAAARLPNVDLRWICELDDQRRASAAAVAPAARLTAALDEALADPGVAAALVAVDAPRHHAVGRRVLQADRHLLLEKPMAMTVAHARELSALAESRRRVLSVGHLLLHHPAIRRARELVQTGAIGQALWLESTRLAPGPARSAGGAWWTLAPHDVSLALHFFGAVPARVTAVSRGDGEGGLETVVWATLHFADGALAHIHVARRAPERRRGFQVVGARRSLSFDELSAGGELRVHDPARGPTAAAEVVPIEPADPLAAQCLHFVSGVARGDVSAGNAAHALAVVRVLEAGARSMQQGGAPADVA